MAVDAGAEVDTLCQYMHKRSAPEARGWLRSKRRGLAGFLSLLPVLIPALAAPIPSTLSGIAFATTAVDDGASRQLQIYLDSDSNKPNFTLADVEGTSRELKEQAGRIVLVHFFATWCEPCREELPPLSRLIETLGRERVVVLAVNVAEVPARVRRFLETAPVSFPVLLDADRAVTKSWGVNGLPTTFVLDRELRVRLFVEGDIDWTSAETLAALDRL